MLLITLALQADPPSVKSVIAAAEPGDTVRSCPPLLRCGNVVPLVPRQGCAVFMTRRVLGAGRGDRLTPRDGLVPPRIVSGPARVKRFYTQATTVALDGGWSIALDARPIRTPAKAAFLVPTLALADAIAAEWAAQGAMLKPETMPLTGFAYAAIDRVGPDPMTFARSLAAFAETELLCYRAEGPAALVAAQAAGWDPLLAWARARYDVDFTVTTGIIHCPQPAATLARIDAAYAALDAFRLAALHPVVTICGSGVIGLAVVERRLDADAAFAAGQLDELWQAEQWGSDPLAAASLAERRAALADATRLIGLLVAC